uniref:C2H2-type domain-containing protein n=1 Tax=Spongospora subterranea TaxID=70186 RepID=A0A0H5R976_9EUKA|eukprot:CRZ10306.1 hypothetical protein [Spongospora subterranea]
MDKPHEGKQGQPRSCLKSSADGNRAGPVVTCIAGRLIDGIPGYATNVRERIDSLSPVQGPSSPYSVGGRPDSGSVSEGESWKLYSSSIVPIPSDIVFDCLLEPSMMSMHDPDTVFTTDDRSANRSVNVRAPIDQLVTRAVRPQSMKPSNDLARERNRVSPAQSTRATEYVKLISDPASSGTSRNRPGAIVCADALRNQHTGADLSTGGDNADGRTRKYSCDVCLTSFTRKANLSRHQLVHTGDRPFSCSLCTQRFSLGSNLKRHISRVHKVPRKTWPPSP